MDLTRISLDQLGRLAIILIVLVLAFIVVRYFFHLVHFVVHFFWHGCLVIVIAAIVLGVLHFYFHVF